jgi:hypothetical protein
MPIVKEMALTPPEFERSLAVALQGMDYRLESDRADAGTEARGLTITFRALSPRRMSALLSLPRAEVTIAFRGYAPGEEADFLARFDRAFQRGGG